MTPPTPQQPPLDPTLVALNQRQQQQDILAIQNDVQQQSASLLARYGTRLAFAQGGTAMTGSPLLAKAGPMGGMAGHG